MEERKEHDRCDGCRHYLGGGCCRLNVEKECAAGGFELWEGEAEKGTHRGETSVL